MDERSVWAITEAETAVYAKYLDITEAKAEFENHKSNALFTGCIGVMCVASAVVFEDVDVNSRYDFGLLDAMNDLYGLTGVVLLGATAQALYKTVKYHSKMHS